MPGKGSAKIKCGKTIDEKSQFFNLFIDFFI